MNALRKRSFTIAGHRTSVALEPEFWAVLEREAQNAGSSLAAFVASIDAARGIVMGLMIFWNEFASVPSRPLWMHHFGAGDGLTNSITDLSWTKWWSPCTTWKRRH